MQYLLTFAVMLAVGLVIGQLTAGLRFQARVATHRERRSRSLFEVARELSGVLVVEQVVETAAQGDRARVPRRASASTCSTDDDRLTLAGAPADAPGLDLGTAQWAFDHRAGRRPRHRHACPAAPGSTCR